MSAMRLVAIDTILKECCTFEYSDLDDLENRTSESAHLSRLDCISEISGECSRNVLLLATEQ